MTRLPRVTGKEIVSCLKKAGFVILRQKGSHLVMRHETDLTRRCVIPLQGSKIIKPGTFHSIIKGAGISAEDFFKLL